MVLDSSTFCLLKEDAEVKVVSVAGRNTVVGDGGASVELCVGVDVHEGVPLGGVEHMSDAQALQTRHVHGRKAAVGRQILYLHLIESNNNL